MGQKVTLTQKSREISGRFWGGCWAGEEAEKIRQVAEALRLEGSLRASWQVCACTPVCVSVCVRCVSV